MKCFSYVIGVNCVSYIYKLSVHVLPSGLLRHTLLNCSYIYIYIYIYFFFFFLILRVLFSCCFVCVPLFSVRGLWSLEFYMREVCAGFFKEQLST